MAEQRILRTSPFLIVDDVVAIAFEIEATYYGCRDFDVADCKGYMLCFGQKLEGT